MQSKSAAAGLTLWLALTLFATNVSSQQCKIEIGGAEVTEDNVRAYLADTDPAGTNVLVIDIIGASVKGAVFEEVKYLDVAVADDKITVTNTEQFTRYEQTETTATFSNLLTLTCADDSVRTLTVATVIDPLTNNYAPEFENLNNAAGDAYEFKLPMPFPKSVNVNWAFGVDIRALDFDIGNENVAFEIDDAAGNFEIVAQGASNDPKKRFSLAVKTLKLLELTQPTSFTIKATDNSPDQDSKTKTVTVYINIDEENTTPRSPSFSSIFYQAEITDPTAVGPIVTHANIEVLDPPTGTIVVALSPAPGNDASIEDKFKATIDAEGVVTIELLEPLDEDALLNPVVAMQLDASEATSGFSARTVVHILLPWDGCSTCSTTTTVSPATCPTSPPCPTCPPETSCPTCPTSPTGPTCPTCPPPTSCPTSTPVPTCPTCGPGTGTCPTCGPGTGTCPTCAPGTGTCPTSPACPTLGTCPTPPPCPTSAPCTTTTPKPPASIAFLAPSYSTTVEGKYTGPLFTVKAEIANGANGTIRYGVKPNSAEMTAGLAMNAGTGELRLNVAATPGSYAFEITALYVEQGDVASVIGYLDVSSFGECEDGSTCFKYALVTVDASEASDIANLLPDGTAPPDANCEFSIDEENVVPALGEWFTINKKTGALSISKKSNAEDPAFAGMASPQVRLRLRVDCSPEAAGFSNRLEEAVTKTEMIVVVNIINRNEHNPVFVELAPIVGYPDEAFAQQLFPGSVCQVKATDADRGDDEKIRFSFERLETEFTIDGVTGEIYPVDGMFNYRTSQINVVAKDSEGVAGALSATTLVTVQIIKETDTAVAVIGDAHIQDVDAIIEELNTEHENYSWGVLRTSYMAERPEPTRRRRELDGGLLLVLYAVNKNNLIPATHEEIKSMLSDLETSDWTVSAVETWKVAGGWDGNSGSGSSGSEESLTVAVITLSVILALCLVAIAFIVYFTVYRRSKIDKMIAKYGIKNRTSFSKHRESIAVEVAKKSHVTGLELPKEIEGEMEERKKSTVKFNDEPELIPTDDDVVRL